MLVIKPHPCRLTHQGLTGKTPKWFFFFLIRTDVYWMFKVSSIKWNWQFSYAILLWKCLWSLHHRFSWPSAVTKMERTVKIINLCPEPCGGLTLTDCQTSTQLLSHSSPWKGWKRKLHRKSHGLVKVQLRKAKREIHYNPSAVRCPAWDSKASIVIALAWEDRWHHHKYPPIILLSFSFYF